jgi:hypothetical protein
MAVGRMQIALPGDVDIASNSPAMIRSEYSLGSAQPRSEFEDGQYADFSHQQYIGQIFVSPLLDRINIDLIMKAAVKAGERARGYAKATHVDPSTGEPLHYQILNIAPLLGFADRVNAAVSAIVVAGGHALVFNSSGLGYKKVYTWAEVQPSFESFMHGIEPRALNTVPHKQGVCLPFFFIADDGKKLRGIGTTYRLKAHPDITVVLEEGNAVEMAPGMDPSKFTAKYDNEFFWAQRYQDGHEGVHMLWLTLHSLKLAGIKGESSFVELTHEDGTVDYGYFAAARAGDLSQPDAADLSFHVIRRARDATAKGVQPVSKEDFIRMSEAIAASIEPHPIDDH